MSRSVKWRALLVVALGGTGLLSTPNQGSAFECGFAECIVTETCPDMQQFCELHNCITELYNCGELFACSGNKRLHWCGIGPGS